MNRILSFLIAFTLSTSAFALTDEELVSTCWERGVYRIKIQAEAWNCRYDENQIKIESISNDPSRPSQFLWFRVSTKCPNGFEFVQKRVQYFQGQCI